MLILLDFFEHVSFFEEEDEDPLFRSLYLGGSGGTFGMNSRNPLGSSNDNKHKACFKYEIHGELCDIKPTYSGYINLTEEKIKCIEINKQSKIVISYKEDDDGEVITAFLNTDDVKNIEKMEKLCGFEEKELQVAALKHEVDDK